MLLIHTNKVSAQIIIGPRLQHFSKSQFRLLDILVYNVHNWEDKNKFLFMGYDDVI